MDSIPSRRNHSPFRTSNSYAASRRVDNLPHRQSSTIASSISFNSGFSPQRTAYNSRQSLSRSYDSPEGIRRMSLVPAKKASSSLIRRAASPPACSSSSKQHISVCGRNQTILDDAAWMSERLVNLQRTGILRYPSISKLRTDPVVNQVDEPLSAFRLSEVTLSEEDLLTDISCSRDFSTSPGLMQSSSNFDQVSSTFYQGSPLSQDIGKDYQIYMQQNNVSANPSSNAGHPHSAAASESTSSNVREDLLLRLEALQYRAELAAKGGNESSPSNTNGNQDNQNSKQLSCWDQSILTSNQKWNAFSQHSYTTSSASPTHSNLSMESISWQQEPGNYLDSTCWLKDIKQEAKAEPSGSLLNRSSSRTIRPEYYLPLSKEEEPVFEPGSSPFSSPKGEKRTELRNDNIRRSAFSVCQQKSEEVRPGKSRNNHKQRSLAQKSKCVFQSSSDSPNGYVKAGRIPANSSPKRSPGITRRTLPTEARCPQNHLCAEYKGIAHLMQEQSESINQSFEMKAFASEMDGQTRNSLENKFEYDGESSWISEENVEGFLCSRSFTLDEADALSTSNEWSSPFLDTNLMHSTAKTTSSLSSKGPSRNKNIEELQIKDSGKGLFSSSRTACFNEEVIEGSNDTTSGTRMFDCCKEVHLSSQGGSTITSQIDTQLQLLKEGSLADSCEATNLSHQSGCQVSQSADESPKNNLIACCKETLSNEQSSKKSHYDPGVKEQISGIEDSSSRNDVSPKDLNIMIEESVENNMTVVPEKKPESTSIWQCHSARYSFHSSIPLISEQQAPLSSDALSSPSDLLGEDQHWPASANGNENTTHISKMHKSFARIVRSLSFSERGQCEIKSSSKLQNSTDISKSESTGFAHHWIPSSAYSLTSFDLENDGGKYSIKMQQTNAQITKEQLQGTPSQNGMRGMDREPEGNAASLILLDNSCTTDLNIDQLAEEPCVMAHTVLLSKSESDANLDSSCAAPLSSKDSSQLYHDLQLDSPSETHCNVQDNSRIEKVQEDIKSWPQVKNRVPKGGTNEIDDKGCQQQSRENFTVQESFCTKTLRIEPEVMFEKLNLSEEQMGIASSATPNKGLMVEGVNKGDMVFKFSCPSGPENCRGGETPCGKGETPSSLLSIYKNPLWRDEANMDFENGHGCQNQEFLDHSYSDEGNFLDSDQNRIGFSKRSLGAVWDTYEGMGGFINSFPNSPSCATKQASEANQNLMGFDTLINSSESNSFVLDSVWDLESNSKQLRKIGEEASEIPGSFTQLALSCHSQVEQCQQSAQNVETKESQTINHDALSLSPESISWLKRNLTSERDSISDSARILDGSKDCLRDHGFRPYTSSSHSTKLIDSNPKHQDATLVSNESTINDFFLTSGQICTTWKKMVPVTEMTCETDEVRGGREALDQLDCNGNAIGKESILQNSGASINIERISASQCADRKPQIDPLCGQHNKECVQPVHHKLSFAKADAPEENHSVKDLVMHSNDGTEAGEEVKQVTFIYSDSKEPQKDLQAVEASIPEVPLDLLSTWILSFFNHASKGGVNIKRKEQKQPLIQEKALEDRAELKRIGKKVQALEAEIDRFKHENRKLQSLVKCMIRKVKQLQQGLRGRKRNGNSRGFMTCIYSVRIKRSSKSKFSRKS